MKIGIIGAGRVGCSIGKYLRTKDIELAGYYDVDSAAAKEAAEFTRTESFDSLKQLANQSQIIFITTPDSFIIPVWEQLKELSLRNQIICHCSGALSSDSFSGAKEAGVSCCSVHPMLPFSNKFSSYQQLEHAFFTVEGHPYAVEIITDLLTSYGNEVCQIDGKAKPKYHAAASILSNQVIAVLDMGYRLLKDCGFSREKAIAATAALVRQNIENVISQGCVHALTGPIDRGDVSTVEKHLQVLNPEDAALYRMLGTRLLAIAKEKNPAQNYENMEHVLNAVAYEKENGGFQ